MLIISSNSLWVQGKSRQEDCEVHWKGGTEELAFPCWNVGKSATLNLGDPWGFAVHADDHQRNRHVD